MRKVHYKYFPTFQSFLDHSMYVYDFLSVSRNVMSHVLYHGNDISPINLSNDEVLTGVRLPFGFGAAAL